ncbi:small RNA 2'-O-methyltransferase isoform X1 [Solea solea]|uniref:small RNA 2'-O-methyltransferase isoform X1 n=1 Tax=Solea solea TaxID=90069 RepID=UPI00272D0CB7|nr:small RNA 2'-O-methyltransferase isoform X1 [Solea solea]XP_058494961.1 small RNA 2'-O-methyltransferase isoform X1 [Solea solea]XP_058494962.1 small RNA 2'-O-methyltransferase isoform X1 [Solea solea]
MEPLFSPALHRQRHQFVIDFVKRNKPRKVVDLGCAECTLLEKLRWFQREIDLLVGVDIDGTKVKKKMHALAPMATDYLQPSYEQLCVELYQGSVTQKDARLRGFDLVTSIELIEHLTLDDVECFSEVVFGYMNPVDVIISTPNSEFNPFLPGLSGFRHSDHKFEWTRAEFKTWAQTVCLKFGYEVEFTGVGAAPPGQQESVGFCSQIGVFHRLEGKDGCNMLRCDNAEDVFAYTLLYSINYPSLRDNNILRRVLVCEVLRWTENLKSRWSMKTTCDEALCGIEGGEEECLSERCMEVEEEQTVCGAEMRELMGPCEKDLSKDQENDYSKLQRRCESVPLEVLWSHCPKVSALSGSLDNLRRILTDDPDVNLSQDGNAVLLQYDEQDLGEKEEQDDLQDSGYAEARQHCLTAEQEEDWGANV